MTRLDPDADVSCTEVLPNPRKLVHRVALPKRSVPVHVASVDEASGFVQPAPGAHALLQVLCGEAGRGECLAHPMLRGNVRDEAQAQLAQAAQTMRFQHFHQIGTETFRSDSTQANRA